MNKPNKHDQQLTLEQRYPIWSLRDTGKALGAIGLFIGFDKNTVSRELKRNRDESGYKPKTAEKTSQSRQSNAHKASKKNEAMDEIMVKKAETGLVTGSISERLKVEKKAELEHLSHTSH